LHRFVISSVCILLTLLLAGHSLARPEFTCASLETCKEKLNKALLHPNADLSEFSIANSFGAFGDTGWNSLFEIMERNEAENQKFIIVALAYLSESRIKPLSHHQFSVITALWHRQPDFMLGSILSRHDTPQAHALLIAAMGSQNNDLREAALLTMQFTGIGRPTTSISNTHLPEIIVLMEAYPDLQFIELITRMEGPQADIALWTLLTSDNPQIFADAYKVLQKRDEKRLIRKIFERNANLTPDQRSRALMIGNQITNTPYEKQAYVTNENIEYYERKFTGGNVSPTSKLIPFLVLRKMRLRAHDTTKSGEPISVAIRLDKILLSNEEAFRNYYFEIVEASIEAQLIRWDVATKPSAEITFNDLLDDHIRTPKKWVKRVRPYLKDPRLHDIAPVIDFLTRYDENSEFLKSVLMARLDKNNDWKVLNHAMMAIAQHDKLRNDPEIRKRLKIFAKEHPITFVRAAAQHTLSGKDISPRLQNSYLNGYFWRNEKNMAFTINEKRPYCTPPKGQKAPVFGPLPTFPKFTFREAGQLGAARDAIRTANGWLVGYNAGEFGGGLVYYPDGAPKGQILTGHGNKNVLRIIESDTPNTYWVLTGLNHLIDWGSAIHAVNFNGGSPIMQTTKLVPNTPYMTILTENGDLFMKFTAPPAQIIDHETGEYKSIPNPKYYYNPPLLLTKAGVLKSACEKNAPDY